jgi:HD-GYP domain-containing protein (c-di-GMP phosphodiesterase class II)
MDTDKRQATKILMGAIILLAIFMAGGIWGITSLVRYEHQRDINTWQVTLNIMADSRATAVRQWADSQLNHLNELSQNSSLQLYTQELLKKRTPRKDGEPAELSYLRNLIRASASRYGFRKGTNAPAIPANISRQTNSGLALIGPDQQIIAATTGMPTITKALRQSITSTIKDGVPKAHDIVLSGTIPLAAFLQPVFALEMPGKSGRRVIAVLLALKNASTSLFPLLKSHAAITKTDEAILVRRQGNLVTYISPLADGTPPLKRKLAAGNNDLAAAYAINHPGSFKQLRDYTGQEVLTTSRALPGLPWILVQKITVSEALNESQRHQRFLYIILSLTLILAATLLLAAWFYGSSAREHKITAKLLAKSRQLAGQTRLLNSISDNIHDYIFLVSFDGHLIFANQLLTTALSMTATEVKNKTLTSIFGPAPAGDLQPFLQEAGHDDTAVFKELPLEINGKTSYFHASFIPILQGDRGNNDAVLVSLHDVTLLRNVQEKKNRLMNQIVKALMQAIDQHDPYSTNHSANTAKIALTIGRAMNLDLNSLNTLETAANLCNIGKLSISRELLAKTGPITETEEKELQSEIDFAKSILADIDFEGPVMDTIIQKNEFLDGSGYPAGLTDKDIILTARILSAANAFVAMISPRAYRDKLPIRDALNEILAASDDKYDRQVVAALFHVADNEIDWKTW